MSDARLLRQLHARPSRRHGRPDVPKLLPTQATHPATTTPAAHAPPGTSLKPPDSGSMPSASDIRPSNFTVGRAGRQDGSEDRQQDQLG